jgi:hypothetical protein
MYFLLKQSLNSIKRKNFSNMRYIRKTHYLLGKKIITNYLVNKVKALITTPDKAINTSTLHESLI